MRAPLTSLVLLLALPLAGCLDDADPAAFAGGDDGIIAYHAFIGCGMCPGPREPIYDVFIVYADRNVSHVTWGVDRGFGSARFEAGVDSARRDAILFAFTDEGGNADRVQDARGPPRVTEVLEYAVPEAEFDALTRALREDWEAPAEPTRPRDCTDCGTDAGYFVRFHEDGRFDGQHGYHYGPDDPAAEEPGSRAFQRVMRAFSDAVYAERPRR